MLTRKESTVVIDGNLVVINGRTIPVESIRSVDALKTHLPRPVLGIASALFGALCMYVGARILFWSIANDVVEAIGSLPAGLWLIGGLALTFGILAWRRRPAWSFAISAGGPHYIHVYTTDQESALQWRSTLVEAIAKRSGQGAT